MVEIGIGNCRRQIIVQSQGYGPRGRISSQFPGDRSSCISNPPPYPLIPKCRFTNMKPTCLPHNTLPCEFHALEAFSTARQRPQPSEALLLLSSPIASFTAPPTVAEGPCHSHPPFLGPPATIAGIAGTAGTTTFLSRSARRLRSFSNCFLLKGKCVCQLPVQMSEKERGSRRGNLRLSLPCPPYSPVCH